MRKEKIPTYTVDLLKLLDVWFPDKFVDPMEMSEIEYYKLAGKLELINTIKDMINNDSTRT